MIVLSKDLASRPKDRKQIMDLNLYGTGYKLRKDRKNHHYFQDKQKNATIRIAGREFFVLSHH
jgi:hypothetical protein